MTEIITIYYPNGEFKYRELLWKDYEILRKIHYSINGKISNIDNPAVINYNNITKKINITIYQIEAFWFDDKLNWQKHIKNI
jgi:hypothetical protein